MYAKASQQQGAQQQTSQESSDRADSGKTKKEDVVDADFEEVKE